MDTVFRLEHLVLTVNFLAARWGGLDTEIAFIYVTAVASLAAHGTINWLADRRLRHRSKNVNARSVEKFISGRRRKFFAPVEQGTICRGDILRLHEGQEIPCDCLILSVAGGARRQQACYQRGSTWDDSRRPSLKKSLLRMNAQQDEATTDGMFCSSVSETFKWEYNHYGYLSGSHKQADNQAAGDIDTTNVLNRGASFSDAQCVIAMAINVGHMAMGSEPATAATPQSLGEKLRQFAHFLQRKPKRLENVYSRLLWRMHYLFLIASLAPSFLIMFQEFTLTKTAAHSFAQNVLGDEFGLLYALRQYLGVAAGFMINLPYLAGPCMEVLYCAHAYFVASDANLVPAEV